MWHAQGLAAVGDLPRAEGLAGAEKDPGANGTQDEIKWYRACALLYAQTLRQQKKFPAAEAALNAILGTKEKPNWGAKNIDALKERINLYVDQDQFYDGAVHAAALVKALAGPAGGGGALRGHYMDAYYLYTLCVYKHGNAKNLPQNEKDAGSMIGELE